MPKVLKSAANATQSHEACSVRRLLPRFCCHARLQLLMCVDGGLAELAQPTIQYSGSLSSVKLRPAMLYTFLSNVASASYAFVIRHVSDSFCSRRAAIARPAESKGRDASMNPHSEQMMRDFKFASALSLAHVCGCIDALQVEPVRVLALAMPMT